VPEGEYTVPIGQAKVVREGRGMTVLGWGAMFHEALQAVEQAPELDAELIDLRTLWPLDVETVTRSVEKTGRCAIVQEAPRTCGFAAEISALCAFSAIKNNDRVGLVLATEVVEKLVPPKKGDKHVMRVIREILGYEPKYTGTNLKVALETLSKVAKRRSVAFVISDFFATGFERALALAAAKHDVIPVMLTDPRDEELPDVGLCAFEDLETGEEVVVDTSDPRVREHYKATMKGVRRDREKLFQKLALDHAVVRTDQSFVTPIRNLFAKRARRFRR